MRKGEKIGIYTDKRGACIGQTLIGLSTYFVQMVLYKFIFYLFLHETMDDWDKENFGEGFELKKEITSAEQA
jgi:hypothetical protein